MVYKQTRCKNCNTIYTYFDFGCKDECLDRLYCPNCLAAINKVLSNIKKRYEGRLKDTDAHGIEYFKEVIDKMPRGEFSLSQFITEDTNVLDVYDITIAYTEYRVIFYKDGRHRIMIKMQYDLQTDTFTDTPWLSTKQYDIIRFHILYNKPKDTSDIYDTGTDSIEEQ